MEVPGTLGGVSPSTRECSPTGRGKRLKIVTVWVRIPSLLPTTFYYLTQMFSAFKHLIPQPLGYMDEEKRYNVGLTWIDHDGLTDVHNIEIKYARNCERLAIEMGQPQPDGSWLYKEANGTTHVMSADRVKAFMSKTQEHASIMCGMLDKMTEAGIGQPTLEVDPAA